MQRYILTTYMSVLPCQNTFPLSESLRFIQFLCGRYDGTVYDMPATSLQFKSFHYTIRALIRTIFYLFRHNSLQGRIKYFAARR